MCASKHTADRKCWQIPRKRTNPFWLCKNLLVYRVCSTEHFKQEVLTQLGQTHSLYNRLDFCLALHCSKLCNGPIFPRKVNTFISLNHWAVPLTCYINPEYTIIYKEYLLFIKHNSYDTRYKAVYRLHIWQCLTGFVVLAWGVTQLNAYPGITQPPSQNTLCCSETAGLLQRHLC